MLKPLTWNLLISRRVQMNFQLHHWSCMNTFSIPCRRNNLECNLCRGLCKINVLLQVIEVVELTKFLCRHYDGFHSFFKILSMKTFYYIKLHYYRMKSKNITTLDPWKWNAIVDDNKNKRKAFRRDTIHDYFFVSYLSSDIGNMPYIMIA